MKIGNINRRRDAGAHKTTRKINRRRVRFAQVQTRPCLVGIKGRRYFGAAGKATLGASREAAEASK